MNYCAGFTLNLLIMSLHTCFPHGDPICLHVITKFSFNCAISPHQLHHSLANVQYPIGSAPYIFVCSYAIFFRWRNFSTPIASFVCIANTQYRIIAQTGWRHPICLHVITKFLPFNCAISSTTDITVGLTSTMEESRQHTAELVAQVSIFYAICTM